AIYAYMKYVQKEVVPEADHVERSFLEGLSYHKFYVDEIYDFLIVNPLNSFSRFLYRIVDRSGIEGIVNGLGRGVSESGKMLRLLQSGIVVFYLFLMFIGAVLLLFYGIYTI